MIESIIPFVLSLVDKYPASATVFMVIGVLRAVFKPIMTVLAAYVEATPTQADDEWLAKLQENKFYKYFAWFVDYAASIKLPGQK